MEYKRNATVVYKAPRGGKTYRGVLAGRTNAATGEWWVVALKGPDGKTVRTVVVRPKSVSEAR
jgi:hypothetical protein